MILHGEFLLKVSEPLGTNVVVPTHTDTDTNLSNKDLDTTLTRGSDYHTDLLGRGLMLQNFMGLP